MNCSFYILYIIKMRYNYFLAIRFLSGGYILVGAKRCAILSSDHYDLSLLQGNARIAHTSKTIQNVVKNVADWNSGY